MNGTGPRQGNFVGNMSINNPTTGDTLIFNTSGQWENTPATSVGTTVNSDGTTIQGDGSIGDPLSVIPGSIAVESDNITLQGVGTSASTLRLKRVYSDVDTLDGDGILAAPLKLRKVYHDGTIFGLGTSASPIGVTASTVSVSTDADTLTGDGVLATPIKLAKVYHDTTITGLGTAVSPLGVVASTVAVSTDGDTIVGDGTSGSPLEIGKVYVGEKLTGLGTSASPVAFTGVSVDSTLSGLGTTASPLTVVSAPAASISVTASDFDGNGSTLNPLALDTRAAVTTSVINSPRLQFNTKGICTYAEPMHILDAYWKTSTFSVANNTNTYIDDSSTDGTYQNYNGGNFNTATKVYTTSAAGMYEVHVTITWPNNGTGVRAIFVEGEQTAASGVYKDLGHDTRSAISGVTASQCMTASFYMPNAAKFRIGFYQNSGGTFNNLSVYVAMTLVHD
jgi:hypothetical protein